MLCSLRSLYCTDNLVFLQKYWVKRMVLEWDLHAYLVSNWIRWSLMTVNLCFIIIEQPAARAGTLATTAMFDQSWLSVRQSGSSSVEIGVHPYQPHQRRGDMSKLGARHVVQCKYETASSSLPWFIDQTFDENVFQWAVFIFRFLEWMGECRLIWPFDLTIFMLLVDNDWLLEWWSLCNGHQTFRQ